MSQETFPSSEAPRHRLSDILDQGLNTLDVVIAENDHVISEASMRLQRSQNLQPVYHELKNELEGLLRDYVAIDQVITELQARKSDQEATLNAYQQEIDAGYEHQERLGGMITDVERLGMAMANGKDFWVDHKGERHDVSIAEQQDFFSDPQLPDSPQKRLIAERSRCKAELEHVKSEIETLIISRHEARQSIARLEEDLEPLLQKQRQFRLAMSAIETKIGEWYQGVSGLAASTEGVVAAVVPAQTQANLSLSGNDNETLLVSLPHQATGPSDLPVLVENLPHATIDVGLLQSLGRTPLKGTGIKVIATGIEA